MDQSWEIQGTPYRCEAYLVYPKKVPEVWIDVYDSDGLLGEVRMKFTTLVHLSIREDKRVDRAQRRFEQQKWLDRILSSGIQGHTFEDVIDEL